MGAPLTSDQSAHPLLVSPHFLHLLSIFCVLSLNWMLMCLQSLLISLQTLNTLSQGCRLVGQSKNGDNSHLWLLWKDPLPQSMSPSSLSSPYRSLKPRAWPASPAQETPPPTLGPTGV